MTHHSAEIADGHARVSYRSEPYVPADRASSVHASQHHPSPACAFQLLLFPLASPPLCASSPRTSFDHDLLTDHGLSCPCHRHLSIDKLKFDGCDFSIDVIGCIVCVRKYF